MYFELKKKSIILLRIISITIFLFILIDLLIGKNIYKKFIRKNFVDVETNIGMKDDIFDHKFKPSLNTIAAWGPINFRLCTDSHGFRSDCSKQYSDNKSFDIAFIGDSFTEPVGLEYEKSFVGIIANSLKNKKIVNLASPSYSTSIYFAKINHLIKEGFKFKEIIVFIDVSDLVDDALCYKLENEKVIRRNTYETCLKSQPDQKKFEVFFRENFYLSKEIFKFLNINSFNFVPAHVINNLRSSWTYNYDKDRLKYSYDEMSELMFKNMNNLYNLLASNDIDLSVAVYPWPGTLYNDQSNNLHFAMWKKFCEGKCKNFYDFMYPFFELKKTNTNNVIYKTFYFKNDVHFNSQGNKIIADFFLKNYK